MAFVLPAKTLVSGISFNRKSGHRQAGRQVGAPRTVCCLGPQRTQEVALEPSKNSDKRIKDEFHIPHGSEAPGWDDSCVWTEVANPLTTCDGGIQNALLESEQYRALVPLKCWSQLLESEAPLGVIIGHNEAHNDARATEALATREDSTAWHLPIMQTNASASIWRTLLEDSEAQPASTKALIGTILYGLGDVLAQVLEHKHVTSYTELASIMALGAIFEGVCNPWWNSEINRRILEMGSANAARVRSLRFFLNYLVWTPLCCEFYLVYINLVQSPVTVVDVLSTPHLVDALLGLPDANAIELVESLESFSDGLIDEIQSQGVYMMGASALTVFVPPPLRPLFQKLVEAGAWTIVD